MIVVVVLVKRLTMPMQQDQSETCKISIGALEN